MEACPEAGLELFLENKGVCSQLGLPLPSTLKATAITSEILDSSPPPLQPPSPPPPAVSKPGIPSTYRFRGQGQRDKLVNAMSYKALEKEGDLSAQPSKYWLTNPTTATTRPLGLFLASCTQVLRAELM